MDQQEYFIKMQMFGQEAERLEQQMQAIDQQISELSAVKSGIEDIEKLKDRSILANLGKGIFAKAKLEEDKLFVNIGKEIMIKKTPSETITIIEEQSEKLIKGKEEVIARIQELQENMQELIMKNEGHHSCESEECGCSEEGCECEEPCEDCECKKGN